MSVSSFSRTKAVTAQSLSTRDLARPLDLQGLPMFGGTSCSLFGSESLASFGPGDFRRREVHTTKPWLLFD